MFPPFLLIAQGGSDINEKGWLLAVFVFSFYSSVAPTLAFCSFLLLPFFARGEITFTATEIGSGSSLGCSI